ncbi:MAG TPA: mercuric reductase [Gemmatimonadales bacterium]|nr:mercuric reductase [Gemmatimonadales bacterium]
MLHPPDEQNRRLLENVHPPGWVNPEPKSRYHLVVIGAGTAGLVTAAAAAGLGARVALVERHLMGGDCLNVGCVPSKAIIRAARAWHEAREAHRLFGGPPAVERGDFGAAMERMRRIRADLSSIDSVHRFLDLGVDVFLGDGRFVGPAAVEIGGKRLEFRRAVIGTGGRPDAPEIPGLGAAGYLTNETIFSLTALPPRLLVIGAGPVGCELAQAFARFGSQVTVIDRGEHALPREDADAAGVVERAMERDGVVFRRRASIIRVERSGGERLIVLQGATGEEPVRGDEILLAAGRVPNVEGLDLEAAGIVYDRAGVQVNDRLRTSNRRVYAAGDICSGFHFTHAADALARIVVQNALFHGRARASRLIIPWTTYTSPEVAHVGMYEKDARTAGLQVDTLTISMHQVDRAVLDGETEGFLRVHLKKGTDRILGATLVAEHAGEMISEISVAMTAGLGLRRIGATIHPYPTQAEVFRKAADAWRRKKLTPSVKRVLQLFFRFVR